MSRDPAQQVVSRVAFVLPRLVRGGAQQQVLLVGGELACRGWPVTVVSLSEPEEMIEEFRAAGLLLEHLGLTPGRRGPLASLTALVRAVKLFRGLRPDVLVGMCYLPNVLVKVAGRLAGVPVVVTSIRNERFGGRARERVERATEFLADVTTTNSEVAARSLVARGVASRERMRVIPNALDPGLVRLSGAERAGVRAGLGVGSGEFLWLAVGTLTEQKDYPTLWAAMAELAGEGLAVRLVVAGDGDRRRDLAESLAGLGLDGRVSLLGTRHDVPRLLQAADGYVLSSAWEGLPNSLMEAAAAGLPCVATRVGGVEEIVEDSRCGWLVAPGRPEELAAAMRAVVRDDGAERCARGEAARQAVREQFGLDAVTDRWEVLLGLRRQNE